MRRMNFGDEWQGYTLGQHVEFREYDDSDWELGVVIAHDRADAKIEPWKVCALGGDEPCWVKPGNIRPVETTVAPAPAARQLQYKIDRTSGATQGRNAGTWQNIEVGASSVTAVSVSIPPCAHYQRIQLRQMIPHTDEEILAELRKLNSFGLSERARDILAGRF